MSQGKTSRRSNPLFVPAPGAPSESEGSTRVGSPAERPAADLRESPRDLGEARERLTRLAAHLRLGEGDLTALRRWGIEK